MSEKLISIYFLLFVIIISLVFSHFLRNKREGFDGYASSIKAAMEESAKMDKEAEEDRLLIAENAPAPAPSPGPYTSKMKGKTDSKDKPKDTKDNKDSKDKTKDSKNNTTEGFDVQKPINITRTYTPKTKPSSSKIFDYLFSDANSQFSIRV
jgi:hypothetical protein